MEIRIYEALKEEIEKTKRRIKELDRILERAPDKDCIRLMKMRTDESRLLTQQLEKLSKLAPIDIPAIHAPTPKEWALVRAAILRGEGPAWE